jgi:hypothetical protein
MGRNVTTLVNILEEMHNRPRSVRHGHHWIQDMILGPYLLQHENDIARLRALPKVTEFEDVAYRPFSADAMFYYVTERLRRYDEIGRPFDLSLIEGQGVHWAKALLKECWAHGVSKWSLDGSPWQRLGNPFTTMDDVYEMDEILPAEKFDVMGKNWALLDMFTLEYQLTVDEIMDNRSKFTRRPTKSARKTS